FLAKRGVREDIATFEARNISHEIRQSVEELLTKNKASFDPKNARRARAAATPLANCVKANIHYSQVLERTQPLEKKQAGLLENLRKTESRKTKLEEQLNSVGQKDKSVAEITEELDTLPKRAMLAAAFITYLSAAPEDRRRNSQETWMKASGLQTLLSKEGSLSVYGSRDPNVITSLELAVRFGKTLIIQEMDGVETVLYPLLRRDLIAQGLRYVVQIGDKVIDYNEFRLFLATRNPSPFIPPDAASVVTEVNFNTTRAGLWG
ncbi:unnamed protein product, partial [Coregonus sp. 'balchen']